MSTRSSTDIIKTAKAKCRDCYKCVRACPVKAIGIKDNQAYIDTEKCILCGTCVRECPQHAKRYRMDIENIRELLHNNKVIATVAPSFAGVYNGWKAKHFASALRKLGFFRVEETSIGADIVAKESIHAIKDNDYGGVCSACPVVVSYVEKYLSDNIDILTPVVSPMIAHGMKIKKNHPDVKVVFIGPCIAKKHEAELPKYSGIIDGVITFEELDLWLKQEEIKLKDCPESNFDGIGKTRGAKLFALPGGLLETAGISNNLLSPAVLHTSGPENTIMLLNAALSSNEMEVIEPLFCEGGCINGAGIDAETNIFERRGAIIHYAKNSSEIEPENVITGEIATATNFNPEYIKTREISEQQINEYFEKTGKADPAQRLDCSACGYKNCRENAIAVLSGMAEPTMCLPYVRSLSKKKMDKILESSPNGIVVLDESLTIVSMNSSFRKYFLCSDTIIGKELSYLCDDSNYKKLRELNTGERENSKRKSVIKCYGKQFHNIVYYLPNDKEYVGIYVDISEVALTEEKLSAMREKTIAQVEKLLQHQVDMAQKMTMFLGESTAESEVLIEALINESSD